VSAVKHFKKFCSPDHSCSKGAVEVVQSASKNGLYQLLIQKRAPLPKMSEEKWLPQGKAKESPELLGKTHIGYPVYALQRQSSKSFCSSFCTEGLPLMIFLFK